MVPPINKEDEEASKTKEEEDNEEEEEEEEEEDEYEGYNPRRILGGGGGLSGYKLDMGCVERDEERSEFLSACSKCDLQLVNRRIGGGKEDGLGDVRDSVGQNGLFYALASTLYDYDLQGKIIKSLINDGKADVNARRTTDGWTPIFISVMLGSAPLLSLLLDHGAKLDVVDFQGKTPQDYAQKYNQQKVIEIILHKRNKRPQSRFSIVQREPALSSPSPSTTSSSSSSSPPPAAATDSTKSTNEECRSSAVEDQSSATPVTSEIPS